MKDGLQADVAACAEVASAYERFAMRSAPAVVIALATVTVARGAPAPASAQEPMSEQAAQKLAQGTFREFLELLALPNDAINAPDIQKNVEFLERIFGKRGTCGSA